MKPFSPGPLMLVALLFAACAMAGCKTNSENERQQMSTVVGLAGHARYQDGRSEKWRAVKVGSLIPQGSVIQTDEGLTNAVSISIGRSKRFSASPYHIDSEDLNHVILYANSILKLDRVAAKTVSGKRISDVSLGLPKGSASCLIGLAGWSDYFPPPEHSRGPKLETIAPMPGKPYFEIRSGDIVVHAEHAEFFFFPPKGVSLLFGAAAVEFSNSGITKDVFGYEKYDCTTGEIAEMKFGSDTNSAPDYRWRYLPFDPNQDLHRFEVPHRPF